MSSQTAQIDKYLHKALRQAVEEQRKGRDKQAAKRLRALLKRYPEQADALLQLGQIAQRQGHSHEALEWTERAHASSPHNPHILYQLGMFRQIAGDNEGARKAYLDCLRLAPNMAAAHDNLGVVYQQSGDIPQARKHHLKAIELDPGLFGAWNNLGECERKLGRLEQAITAYEKAIALKPDFDEARTNLGNAWKLTGNTRRAMACFAEVMRRQENGNDRVLAEAHWQMALALLTEQRFDEGWLEYEWRHKVRHLDHPHWYGCKPWYPGENLINKRVLVTREQGIGDEIMFAGCLEQLKSEASTVTLECESRLAPLLQRSFPDITVLPAPLQTDTVTTYNPDFVIGCGSLPALYRLSPNAFPSHSGYLEPDPQRVTFWQERLASLGNGIKVGITWRGGATDDNQRKRSVTLEDWLPILKLPNIIAINLQYGDCKEELIAFHERTGIIIHDWDEHDPLLSLEEHAALISALDLVISIDNSTVHMAGALGKPCWVLLPLQSDWRWFRDRDDSPWYPSVKLFRQIRQQEWQPVFDEVGKQLEQWESCQNTRTERKRYITDASPTVLLLNDTTDWYHWGCTGTSTAIRAQLENLELAIESVAISLLNKITPLPDSIEKFDSEDFFQLFCKQNEQLIKSIANADIIVINGEGTLHGTGTQALRLLYLAYIARLAFGKPVHIVNHSCYPEDRDAITDTLSNALYKKVYQQVSSIAIREPVSAALLQQLGLPVIQSFDCLPLYIDAHTLPDRQRDPRHVVIAGSVSWNQDYLHMLANFINTLRPRGYRFTLLTGARAHAAVDDQRLSQALSNMDIDGLTTHEARSTREWLQVIADAALLLSGRFHHSIAAAFVGTPLIALDSNTPKVRGLMQMLGFPEPLNDSDPEIAGKLMERFEAVMQNPADWILDREQRQRLLQLSKANFTEIDKQVRVMAEAKRRQAKLASGETDIERWNDENNLSAHWARRAAVAASWIPEGAVVLDLGCGAMTLEALLPGGCRYLPCDVVQRDHRTRVCDFNRGEYPDPEDATLVTVLGVLEYLNDPAGFLQQLSVWGLPVILSYCVTELTADWNRTALGMANHLSQAELMKLLAQAGLQVKRQETVDGRQILLSLRLEGQR